MKEFMPFPKGISPKVNVIAFELAYYDHAVYLFNYYTKRTPPSESDRNTIYHLTVCKQMITFIR